MPGCADRFKMRVMRCGVALAATLMIAALLAQRAPAPIYAQAQVVSPNDITTPEAEPQTSLLPTPTPRPGGSRRLTSVTAYVVQEGDTLWSVSLEIGVDLEEMPCVIGPDFRMDQPLVIGDALAPPPAGMVCHQAATGETLESVAALYGVDPASIYWDAWNQLTGVPLDAGALWARLEAGRYLRVAVHSAGEQGKQGGFLAYMLSQPLDVVPFMAYAAGGPQRAPQQSSVPANWPYGSGYFSWPTYGWVSQAYRQDHKAVDIAAPLGAFVMAADRGVVVRAGWNEQGYGLFVVIDHNIDYVTLYSHLQDVYVQEGDVVAQGQVIGAVGSTGNSTGPHLHFEVRDFGARINPLEVLVR